MTFWVLIDSLLLLFVLVAIGRIWSWTVASHRELKAIREALQGRQDENQPQAVETGGTASSETTPEKPTGGKDTMTVVAFTLVVLLIITIMAIMVSRN